MEDPSVPDLPPMSSNPRASLYAEIDFLRDEHVAEWGGPEHDDQHDPTDWIGYIDKQRDKALVAALGHEDVQAYRDRMVRIAALAMDGVASLDRVLAHQRAVEIAEGFVPDDEMMTMDDNERRGGP